MNIYSELEEEFEDIFADVNRHQEELIDIESEIEELKPEIERLEELFIHTEGKVYEIPMNEMQEKLDENTSRIETILDLINELYEALEDTFKIDIDPKDTFDNMDDFITKQIENIRTNEVQIDSKLYAELLDKFFDKFI